MNGKVLPVSSEVDAARYRLIGRLLESLAHDVRNPLNALSINLEVLSEKLKGAGGGTVPAPQEKHLSAIRHQVGRVDSILRVYTDFMSPDAMTDSVVDFSACLARATEILGHESRRRRVGFESQIDTGVRVRLSDPDVASFLALEPLMRGLLRSVEGGAVKVRWTSGDGVARLEVRDSGGSEIEMEPMGLQAACTAQSLPLTITPGLLEIRFALG